MAFIFKRGKRLYCKVKDSSGTWVPKPTPYDVGDEEQAQSFADRLQAEVNRNKPASGSVAAYAQGWLVERSTRNLAAFDDDEARINNHTLPFFGTMRLRDVRPKQFRDFVRLLAKSGLAPRTQHNIIGITRTMFEDAVIDELITANPCKAKAGEIVDKVDADPTWRSKATYEKAEVVTLVSDARIPPGRRVMNALKSLAQLRHGEAAGLPIHAINLTKQPLGELQIATSYGKGRTKTNVTRLVPIYPTLKLLIETWLTDHWPRIYGRKPTSDDLLVPTLDFKFLTANYAGVAFREDLIRLGLRHTAGKRRGRGGHDLRAWGITALQEAGANRDIVGSWTHTKKADVMSGYSRFSWDAMCREMLKLDLTVAGYAMQLVPAMSHANPAMLSPTTNRSLTGDPDGIRTRVRSHSTTPNISQVAAISGSRPIASDASSSENGTCHVPQASQMLGALRDFVLADNVIVIADRLDRRARGVR